ncbi:MAG: peptidoglycan-binding protein [Oscillospiraceae bacterium]|nr:peptidoglycan-binding protein [Oscillospiraceae bacterium]
MTGQPFIPETITVHLGAPDEDAENVTVSFPEYVKNVASSEIFPTWPENSLRANIYAITTFALNRIYTEWYRLKGYNFDITSVTQYDQKFIKNREIFENISQLTDELFNDYVRRQGSVEPLFTQFCNGTTVTCDGLSQWGTVGLAEDGLTPYEILQYYYGDNIDIVKNAMVMTNTPSYPGVELRLGTFGNDVRTIQVQLNRISRNYPAIPKISAVDGTFGVQTENAVRKFQEVFNLPQTGVVNQATWYKIAYIYTSVKRLAELNSEGLNLSEVEKQFEENLVPGMQNQQVRNLQYFLAVIGAYYESVTPVEITGYYGTETENSVRSFQKVYGLPETGIVNRSVWLDIYRAYLGIVESVPIDDEDDVILFQGRVLKEGMNGEDVRRLQEYLTYINKSYPNIPAVNNTGYFGPLTRSSVLAFQRQFNLTQNGVVGAATWNAIAGLYSDLKYGFDKQPYQNPGYIIKEA